MSSNSSELEQAVAVLRDSRQSQTQQAIQRLEQQLSGYADLRVNSYGGLSSTNRERVKLETLQQA
jgi:hypothetical protein